MAAGTGNFLERVFQKLLLNFTWWVNRKDTEGNNVFEGGFLGLDNIGIFDRSAPLPTGGHLEQADGTSWMGMFCLNMLTIALELAAENPSYEDIACKFFEHFIYIAAAINGLGTAETGLWNEEDGLYYDVIHLPDGGCAALKIHSLVCLIPLFAVDTIDAAVLSRLPEFKRRFGWFLRNRPDLIKDCADMEKRGSAIGGCCPLSTARSCGVSCGICWTKTIFEPVRHPVDVQNFMRTSLHL